jgi:hypothetical protein
MLWCAAGLLLAIVYPLLFGGPTLLTRSNYAINIAFLILFAAFLGQSWNIAGGYAGQTSFGHVVFFGTGAYVSTILHVTHGWNPWLAWPVAIASGGLVGALRAELPRWPARLVLRADHARLRRGLPHHRQFDPADPRRAGHADQGRPTARELPVP